MFYHLSVHFSQILVRAVLYKETSPCGEERSVHSRLHMMPMHCVLDERRLTGIM